MTHTPEWVYWLALLAVVMVNSRPLRRARAFRRRCALAGRVRRMDGRVTRLEGVLAVRELRWKGADVVPGLAVARRHFSRTPPTSDCPDMMPRRGDMVVDGVTQCTNLPICPLCWPSSTSNQ